MSLIARVYCDDKLYSLDLSNIDHATIGSDFSDTLRIEGCGLKKGHVVFNQSKGIYTIKAKGMYDRENSPISSDKLSVGKTYSIECEPDIYIAIHPKQADSNTAIGLENIEEIYIGRSSQNNVILHNKRTSSNHCKIYRTSELLKIRDLRSSNGTYVNGRKINEKTLVNGDVINISVYEIVVTNNTLTFYNVGDELELNMETVAERKNNVEERRNNVEERRNNVAESRNIVEERKDSLEEKRDGGTVSMFDVNINVSNTDEQYGIRIKQQVKNGTKSVFDID